VGFVHRAFARQPNQGCDVTLAAHGEQIKTNGAEFSLGCRGVRPPLLPDKPVAQGPPLWATLRSPNNPTT
jgi:hypothetical protein